MRNLNAMTPETETTTHYFWGQAHDFQPHNAEMTERVFQQIKTAFLEDVSVFTMQQTNIGLDPDAPPPWGHPLFRDGSRCRRQARMESPIRPAEPCMGIFGISWDVMVVNGKRSPHGASPD